MKDQTVRYKNPNAFGKSLGLSEIDMELIRQAEVAQNINLNFCRKTRRRFFS